MNEERLETEKNYSDYIFQKYEMEKEFSKYLKASSLLSATQIGKYQGMLIIASMSLPENQKQEFLDFISEMDKERVEFNENYKLKLDNK